jgi:exopolysaccharide biosynthesis WecB/TagA/CpsF family protein/anti-anti-sigma factor
MQSTSPSTRLDRPPIAILGVPFDNVRLAEAVALADEMIATGKPHYAAVVGVDFLAAGLDDVEVRRILFDAHLVLAEDKTVLWASKVLGNPLPEAITISNLLPQLIEMAVRKHWRVFFLGCDDATAAKIAARHPGLKVAGAFLPPDRPLLEMDHTDIQHRLHAAKSDILLVALGSPKQEKWISMNYRGAGAPLALGVGANFDVLLSDEKPPRQAGRHFSKFVRAVLRQWWRLRARKNGLPVAGPNVIPDPFGNLIVKAPERLGAAETQAAQAEWLRAVENSHVLFDMTDTVFADSTGIGALVRLRRRARELGWQFFLIAPRPQVEAALKLMKLDEFFTIQASLAGARIVMESAEGAAPVTSGVIESELQIRWTGEVTALNAVELGMYTESELSQVSAGMTVVIDLSRVTFIDSSGIGLMVRFKKNLKRRDINLKFVAPIASVRNVVRQTQLEEFLLT